MRPEVVVEVTYGERTPDGVLRFPVFVRVRDDVRPEDVVLPKAADTRGRPRGGARAPAHGPDRGGGGRAARSRRRFAGGLAFTNLDKVFFPELGLTKGDVVEYYRRIAPHLVPHLRDRPLTLRRFPNGIHGDDFFQKDVTDAPAFVRRMRVWSDQGKRDIEFVVGADERDALWLAQLGCIEMHAWFSRIAPVPGRGAGAADGRVRGVGGGDRGQRPQLSRTTSCSTSTRSSIRPGTGPTRRHGELDPDYSRRGFDAAREVALWVGRRARVAGPADVPEDLREDRPPRVRPDRAAVHVRGDARVREDDGDLARPTRTPTA